MSSSALAAVCRRLAVHSIFVGSTSHLLLEPPGEMLRILEAKLVGYLTDGFSCVENPFFGCFQGLLLDMLQGGQACFFSQQVTQVIGRKAELVSPVRPLARGTMIWLARGIMVSLARDTVVWLARGITASLVRSLTRGCLCHLPSGMCLGIPGWTVGTGRAWLSVDDVEEAFAELRAVVCALVIIVVVLCELVDAAEVIDHPFAEDAVHLGLVGRVESALVPVRADDDAHRCVVAVEQPGYLFQHFLLRLADDGADSVGLLISRRKGKDMLLGSSPEDAIW